MAVLSGWYISRKPKLLLVEEVKSQRALIAIHGGYLTKEDYAQKVRDIAVAILTECNAEKWKKENEGKEYYDFVDYADYNGSIHSILDATANIHDWKDAVEILQVTEQNPDHVDAGLFEGCNWKRILICIAYESFTWDVNAASEEMYDADEFPQEVMAYLDTPSQKGFFPNNKKFKIPDAAYVVNMHDAIKILISPRYAGKREAELSVVFEGSVEKQGVKSIRYIVDCRRIYNQNANSIEEEDLIRCQEEFGVTEIK